VTKGNVKRFVWVALTVPTVVLALATSAAAAEKEHHPTGEFAKFSQCPSENPLSSACTLAEAHGGEFQIGNMDIPIVKPIVLQAALRAVEETEEDEVIAATDGETLVKAPEVVPGGIFGLVKEGHYPLYLRNFCRNFPNNSECKVTTTAELVGKPYFSLINLIDGEHTALGLPLRFHLKNPFLGAKCYIGSTASPIMVEYGTGTMPPVGVEPEMKGQFGELEGFGNGILAAVGDESVDNAFSAPGAEGCGGPQALIVDREIDQKQALPSPAGHNRSRLDNTLYLVSAETVKESETEA
jgi:hypothetical protein